jgi:hypothetical protein
MPLPGSGFRKINCTKMRNRIITKKPQVGTFGILGFFPSGDLVSLFLSGLVSAINFIS